MDQFPLGHPERLVRPDTEADVYRSHACGSFHRLSNAHRPVRLQEQIRLRGHCIDFAPVIETVIEVELVRCNLRPHPAEQGKIVEIGSEAFLKHPEYTRVITVSAQFEPAEQVSASGRGARFRGNADHATLE